MQVDSISSIYTSPGKAKFEGYECGEEEVEAGKVLIFFNSETEEGAEAFCNAVLINCPAVSKIELHLNYEVEGDSDYLKTWSK